MSNTVVHENYRRLILQNLHGSRRLFGRYEWLHEARERYTKALWMYHTDHQYSAIDTTILASATTATMTTPTPPLLLPFPCRNQCHCHRNEECHHHNIATSTEKNTKNAKNQHHTMAVTMKMTMTMTMTTAFIHTGVNRKISNRIHMIINSGSDRRLACFCDNDITDQCIRYWIKATDTFA